MEESKMKFFKRTWTPQEADEWTKEDWITLFFSVSAYILFLLGTGLSFLLLPAGFILLACGIICTVIMHWIINPKLKVISEEYEKHQNIYLEKLEKKARWEEHNG